jgi:hypothetical protein
MSVHVQEHHVVKAQQIVCEAQAHDGLAPVDLERFWADNARARSNVWAADCPQLPLGIGMSDECIFSELGMDVDWVLMRDGGEKLRELTRRYNDKAEAIIGKRLRPERPPEDPSLRWPARKHLHDLFSRNEEVNMVAECLRDFELSRAHKGVVFTTAGSINYGSRLTGLRLIMSTIQNHCRY